MTTRPLLASLATVGLVVLTGCSGPDLTTEADDLRLAVGDLPRVADVRLDYQRPEFPDPGAVELRVRMKQAATTDDVPRVVATAYEAFAGPHRDESGQVVVELGDDVVTVTAFGPRDDVEVVRTALERVFEVLPSGGVQAFVDTRTLAEGDPLDMMFRVTLPDRSADGEDVLRLLDRLEPTHGDLADSTWIVETAGGWGLMSNGGFPDAGSRNRFRDAARGLPPGATVDAHVVADAHDAGEDAYHLSLADRTPPAVATQAVRRHLSLLGGVARADLQVTNGAGELHATFGDGECWFDDGSTGARLRRDHAAGCTTVLGRLPGS